MYNIYLGHFRKEHIYGMEVSFESIIPTSDSCNNCLWQLYRAESSKISIIRQQEIFTKRWHAAAYLCKRCLPLIGVFILYSGIFICFSGNLNVFRWSFHDIAYLRCMRTIYHVWQFIIIIIFYLFAFRPTSQVTVVCWFPSAGRSNLLLISQ